MSFSTSTTSMLFQVRVLVKGFGFISPGIVHFLTLRSGLLANGYAQLTYSTVYAMVYLILL